MRDGLNQFLDEIEMKFLSGKDFDNMFDYMMIDSARQKAHELHASVNSIDDSRCYVA